MARPRSHSDEEILDAARVCFLAHGPSVSIATIGAQLGLSGPALLHRFGSKKRLLIAAMCPDPSELPVRALQQPLDERPITEQLRDIAEEVTAHMRRIMPHIVVLRAAGISPLEAWSRYEAPPPLILHRALSAWLGRALEKLRHRLAGQHLGALLGKFKVDCMVF